MKKLFYFLFLLIIKPASAQDSLQIRKSSLMLKEDIMNSDFYKGKYLAQKQKNTLSYIVGLFGPTIGTINIIKNSNGRGVGSTYLGLTFTASILEYAAPVNISMLPPDYQVNPAFIKGYTRGIRKKRAGNVFLGALTPIAYLLTIAIFSRK